MTPEESPKSFGTSEKRALEPSFHCMTFTTFPQLRGKEYKLVIGRSYNDMSFCDSDLGIFRKNPTVKLTTLRLLIPMLSAVRSCVLTHVNEHSDFFLHISESPQKFTSILLSFIMGFIFAIYLITIKPSISKGLASTSLLFKK